MQGGGRWEVRGCGGGWWAPARLGRDTAPYSSTKRSGLLAVPGSRLYRALGIGTILTNYHPDKLQVETRLRAWAGHPHPAVAWDCSGGWGGGCTGEMRGHVSEATTMMLRELRDGTMTRWPRHGKNSFCA